ncbi:hypothetical protein, partial [Tardiphaga sp.]|uniref:hypothetical protein n=1 Tax=Tardiphaga sp. TaxID=1926292 RepID=UPI0037DA48F6
TRVSVKGHQSFLNRVQNRDVWKRNKLTEEINKDQTQMEVTRTTLRAAKQFAEQSLSKPLNCLVNWYESSADATAINRHLAVYIDIFGRLRAAADEPQRLEQNQLDDVADRLITLWLAIALEPSVSGPQSLLHEKCDTFLEQFCADEIEAAKKFRQSPRHNVALENLSTTEADTKFGKPLRSCLQKFAPSANGPPRLWPPHLSELRDHLAASIKKFAETGGVKARPYFVVGYASMLAQLGQYRAAGVLLDDWLRMRAVSKSEWQLGDTWFEMRARTTLASYMEEWIRKDDAQPPTTVLDEHLKNLDLIRKDFKIRMLGVKFFEEAFRPSRSFSKVEGICASDDPDIETWRKLFESYVTMELTYAQAMLVHVEYEDRFSEETTELLEQFSVMDFACVPDTVKFDPTPAKVYQAQVLEAFARNALMYNDARKSDGDEAKIKRLDRAIEAIRSAQRALQDALKKSGRATPREASTFLEKVTTSEVTATQDKLRSTLGRVKRAHQELSQ